jgi:hypothetical protein
MNFILNTIGLQKAESSTCYKYTTSDSVTDSARVRQSTEPISYGRTSSKDTTATIKVTKKVTEKIKLYAFKYPYGGTGSTVCTFYALSDNPQPGDDVYNKRGHKLNGSDKANKYETQSATFASYDEEKGYTVALIGNLDWRGIPSYNKESDIPSSEETEE